MYTASDKEKDSILPTVLVVVLVLVILIALIIFIGVVRFLLVRKLRKKVYTDIAQLQQTVQMCFSFPAPRYE